MMKQFHYPSPRAEKQVRAIIHRGLQATRKQHRDVERILENVRKNGDEALLHYTRQFDAGDFTKDRIKVDDDEWNAAPSRVEKGFVRSLKRAARQIEAFHRQQVERSWMQTERPGVILGQMIHPVDAAGVYVPGGRGGETPLVSSVLMGAIPARIAGVRRIVMATPPMTDGGVNPHLLVAARMAGVHAVYKTGSAWAVAALAYGTETVPKVDIIVGPGNIHVTLAKKIVSGTVAIDLIAGPSEILIIADRKANAEYCAADLLSQAEHDVLASAVLVTDSADMARRVAAAVQEQLRVLHRRDIAEQSLARFGGIMIVPDLEQGFDLANRIAPEHLELQIADPFDHLGRIRHAGAVFLGGFTPEPMGDYMAGPNHVLPTAGTARFASALSVNHFIKKTSVIYYSREAFRREAPDVMRLSRIEGLDAHANSVSIRMSAGS